MGLGCRDEGEVREMLDAVLEHLGGVGGPALRQGALRRVRRGPCWLERLPVGTAGAVTVPELRESLV